MAMLDTVEHVPAEDEVFEECRRVLRGPEPAGTPGGKLLVTVPAFMFLWSRNDAINMHQRRYTAPELPDEASAARIQGAAHLLQQLLRLPAGGSA